MNIKEHELYPIYLTYLKSKNLNSGQFNLSKISESKFNTFVDRYSKDEEFMKDQFHIYKVSVRDAKISEVLLENIDDEFEIFLNELGDTIRDNKDDDIFDF
jgi:hypothetical protein